LFRKCILFIKHFKDFLDARNHAKAIDYFYKIIKDERPITQGLMKEINKLLMNLILIKHNYTPTMIKKEQRREYLESLTLTDQGNLAPFIELVANSLLSTQQVILQDLN